MSTQMEIMYAPLSAGGVRALLHHATVLRQWAATLLEHERDQIQGDYLVDCKMCAMGALIITAFEPDELERERDRARDRLLRHWGEDTSDADLGTLIGDQLYHEAKEKLEVTQTAFADVAQQVRTTRPGISGWSIFQQNDVDKIPFNVFATAAVEVAVAYEEAAGAYPGPHV